MIIRTESIQEYLKKEELHEGTLEVDRGNYFILDGSRLSTDDFLEVDFYGDGDYYLGTLLFNPKRSRYDLHCLGGALEIREGMKARIRR